MAYTTANWQNYISSPTGNGWLTPWNFAEYYGFNTIPRSDTIACASGIKIAIVDAYGSPTIQQDLNAFCTAMNIPSTTVQIYLADIPYPDLPTYFSTFGVTTSAGPDGWATETTLDVQYAHALALSATIMLVATKDASSTSLARGIDYAVNTLSADIVSMSFGLRAPSYAVGIQAMESKFTNLNAQYIASSGDTNGQLNHPASSPYVLSVGGTVLSGGNSLYYFGAPGTYSESAWSGSSGGNDLLFTCPDYQTPQNTVLNRRIPDVSLVAAYTSIYKTTYWTNQSGWYKIFGTSISAPCWAAIAAIRKAASVGFPGLQTTNADLYYLANSNPNTYFRDITATTPGVALSSYPKQQPRSGYDNITGLGTPFVNLLAVN
jgi:subtilase family serine protease